MLFFGFLSGRERDRPHYCRVLLHLRASIHLFRSTLLSTGVLAADVPSLVVFYDSHLCIVVVAVVVYR